MCLENIILIELELHGDVYNAPSRSTKYLCILHKYHINKSFLAYKMTVSSTRSRKSHAESVSVSSLLSHEESSLLLSLLGPRCQSLAGTVVQVWVTLSLTLRAPGYIVCLWQAQMWYHSGMTQIHTHPDSHLSCYFIV